MHSNLEVGVTKPTWQFLNNESNLNFLNAFGYIY